jgi:predicted metallopeptidase
MKKTNKSKNYLKVILQIENIRKKNNVNWMNILRIAFQYSPKATAKVMSKIYTDDKKISYLVKKLI